MFEKFQELKSFRNPARGNKSKNREKDFELVSGEPDPETGKIYITTKDFPLKK